MNDTPCFPIQSETPRDVTNDVFSNTHSTSINTLTEMCKNCTLKENGASCGMSNNETCSFDDRGLDYHTLKLATGANGYVKYNNGDNGLTTCLQNHIHTVLESQKDDVLTSELTESSHSGSTVATEESMVSSLSDEKIYTDTGTNNVCTECRCSQSKSCLCGHFYNLCIDGPSTSKHYRDIRDGIEYVVYKSEKQMPDIMRLITKDLSEPYSIYTYRYFIHNWPKLCFLSMDGDTCIGAIVCKLDMHKKMVRRGYIAMLAIDSKYRRRKIGSNLVLKAIDAMVADDCDEVVLETEITNKAALHLYENLGFVRDKRLFHYYLNGVDALRLKLWLR